MNDKTKKAHSLAVIIATIFAVIYSVSTIGCIFLKKSNVFSPTSNDSSSLFDNSFDFNSNFSSIIENNSSVISVNENSSDNNSVIDTSSIVSSSIITSTDVSSKNSTAPSSSSSSSTTSNNSSNDNKPITVSKSFSSAIWYSCYNYDFKGLTYSNFKLRVNKMFDDAVAIGCDAVICHVRPFADSFYPSELFPYSSYLTGTQGGNPGYDPLDYMITAAHQRNLQFHAWLNPYRISISTNDVNTLAESHPARKWLNDSDPSNDRNVLTVNNGIYFNPTKIDTQRLIISGVREILENYPSVDGIHIDDYFYPTTDPMFDKTEFEQYKNSGGTLSQDDWRRSNVNALVSGIYSTVKQFNKVFGVSPSYHISSNKSDDNYNKQYADLAKWMSSDGYIDYIAPQLYFGYNYPTSSIRFDYLLDLWTSIRRKNTVKIYIGLAAYKIGDASADLNSGEWTTATDILANQAKDSFAAKCDGVIIFDYSSITSNSSLATQNRNNLAEVLKKEKEIK